MWLKLIKMETIIYDLMKEKLDNMLKFLYLNTFIINIYICIYIKKMMLLTIVLRAY